MGGPEKSRVELLGQSQMAQFGEARKRRGVECRLIETDPFEHTLQLQGSAFSAPLTAEVRHVHPDLGEGNTIASIVGAARAEGNLAARECPADDLGDVAHGIVLRIVANVEGFSTHGFAWRVQRAEDCLADIVDMGERPAWCSITHHADFSGRVREAGEIVEDEVKPLPGRRAESSCIAQENRREVGSTIARRSRSTSTLQRA